jgi:predicted ATP-grasp superfamily ATP-dependent carboligase
MIKKLVYFGNHKVWSVIYDKNHLMKYLSDVINDVLVFEDMGSLKNYINNEGQSYKNYILPSRLEDIIELKNAGIHSLFDVDSNIIQKMSDKKQFYDYVVQHNLINLVPRHFRHALNDNILVIVKPKNGSFSCGVYKKRLNEVQPHEFENCVVQEYIKHPTEYAGYFASHNGKITHSFAYAENYGDGEFIKHEGGIWTDVKQHRVELDNNIIGKIQKFVEPCSFTGTFSVDFKIVNGKLYVFEINPRIGGSMNRYDNGWDYTNIIKNLIKIYDDRNVYNYWI